MYIYIYIIQLAVAPLTDTSSAVAVLGLWRFCTTNTVLAHFRVCVAHVWQLAKHLIQHCSCAAGGQRLFT